MNVKPLGKSSLDVTYIASSSYSGSTLLCMLMGQHPSIATVGEMTGVVPTEDIEDYRCSCGELIRACSFWKTVGNHMKTAGIDFDVRDFGTRFDFGTHYLTRRLRTGTLRLLPIDPLREALVSLWSKHKRDVWAVEARNRAFIEAALTVTGRPVFLDASKSPLFLLRLSRIPGIQLRVIHLIRDPRAVANSYRKNDGWPVEQAAKNWRRVQDAIEEVLQRTPVRSLMHLRYEDLCREPSPRLEEVLRFCGLEPVAPELALGQKDLHIVGNRMRLRAASEIRLDESWRKELTTSQIRRIERIALRPGHSYGYERG